MQKMATIRFYEELNDFIQKSFRKKDIIYHFSGNPSIKNSIEALGVPHPEVDLIIVNGKSVDFKFILMDQDRVAVYPEFESIDITPVIRLRPKPLRRPRFVLDVHLGKLTRILRMLGFDCAYKNDFSDKAIIKISLSEKRVILTHDQELLKNRNVLRGYWIRSLIPEIQVVEVLARFDLRNQINPFTRCMKCNGTINRIDKIKISVVLEEKTTKYYDIFYQCSDCKQVYWQGTHFQSMLKKIKKIIPEFKFEGLQE